METHLEMEVVVVALPVTFTQLAELVPLIKAMQAATGEVLAMSVPAVVVVLAP